MSFEIHPATRQGVKPLIGIFGRSSSGKTMSALLLARGIVGPSGRIVLVDSESGRGSLFSDIIPGGYGIIDIDPPFSPERYEEAITTAEANADCVVVDSLSHEHGGDGGVLDMQEAELNRMAGNDWKKREACKMASWIKPKLAHKKFVQRLLRMKCGLICCLRAEEKTHMVKGEDGKSKVITDQFSTPLFDPRFIFELLLNFELVSRDGKGGYVIPRKITHPTIAPLLPREDEQIGIKHGEAFARWCAGTSTAQPSAPTTRGTGDLKKVKGRIWVATQAIHQKDPKRLEQWLWDEAIISDTETLEGLTVERLEEVLKKVEAKLNDLPTP